MMKSLSQKKGSVLILSIWALCFLAVFASYIGLRIRQRASVLARVEQKNQLRQIALSGVKKTISLIRFDFQKNADQFNLNRKLFLFNNSSSLGLTKLGRGSFEVVHLYKMDNVVARFSGVEDEEGKININISDWMVIKRLIQSVLLCPDDAATKIADAIINWREIGKKDMDGFYSDDYYENLDTPYALKSAEFEVLDELKLVEGMTTSVYERLLPYITIYGDGYVNVNTASKEVFVALGLDDVLAQKVLQVRKGVDGFEYTLDDYIFQKEFDFAIDVNSVLSLTKEEMTNLDTLNGMGLIKTNSFYYRFLSRAYLGKQQESLSVDVVYNSLENKIEYLREK